MRANPWLEAGYRKTAGHTFVPQDHSDTGVMVALAPPQHVVDVLVLNDDKAEPAHDLHVTMAYLGKTDEYSGQQLTDLPEVIEAWAEGQRPLKALISGAGTFLSPGGDEPHVLHALVNSPGLHLVHASLVGHLRKHGYNPRQNHGFVPHITLGYTKHDVRFLPKVQRREWTVNEVWSAIGGKRRGHRLGR